MIKPEQIPDAAAFALDDARKDPDASPWDLIAAALNAWPHRKDEWRDNIRVDGKPIRYSVIILPLPTENTNDKG